MTAIDDLVRASLQERAGDITTVPPDLFDFDDLKPGPSRRPWLIAAAAAVVVLAVVGMAVALRAREHSSPRPAGPMSCDSPSATAWRAALRHSRSGVNVLAGLTDGSFVVEQSGELVLRLPTGRALNLMAVPGKQVTVQPDGSTALIRLAGDTNAYVLQNRTVGSFELRAPVHDAALQDGRIYYTSSFEGGAVLVYDVARDTTRVLYRGRDLSLDVIPGVEVRWHGGFARKQLTAPVRSALAGVAPSHIFYAGGSYLVPGNVHSSSGGATPTYSYRLVAPNGAVTAPFEEPRGEHIMGIAGHYVVQRSGFAATIHVLDVRTGAILDTGFHGYVNTSGSTIAISTRGVHFVDTTRLPELRC